MSKLTGAIHQLTGVNVRKVGDAVKQGLQNVQWEAAWAEKKRKYIEDGIYEDSIPTICADLANYKLDERAGKVMEGVQHHLGRAYAVTTQAAAPYVASIAQGATAVFQGATEGALKVGEGAKDFFLRGKEYAQAVARRTLKGNQKPVINDFEMFALHQLGFYKHENGNYYHKVFAGKIIAHHYVYRALQNLYKNEQLLLLLFQFYNKKEEYNKKYKVYLKKKEEYEKRVAEYEIAMKKYAKEEQEKIAKMEKDYKNDMAKYDKDVTEFQQKLQAYEDCNKSLLKRAFCKKPTKPIMPTRKEYVHGKEPSLPKDMSVKTPTPISFNKSKLPTRSFTRYLQEGEAAGSNGKAAGSEGGRRYTRRRR